MTNGAPQRSQVAIRPAHSLDQETLRSLLEQNGLPQAGLEQTQLWLAYSPQEVLGCVGLEVYGWYGLLRSLAVSPHWQGKGLGQQLTQWALEQAQQQRLSHLYLLTTTAEGFFPRFGFTGIPRPQVAPALGASAEFRGACPDTAVAMSLRLRTPRVLVLCTHNSARSQMAEGWLRHWAQHCGLEAHILSAGTQATLVKPQALQVMAEVGLDLSSHSSKTLYDLPDPWNFDLVLTVCDSANEACPVYPAHTTRLHHNFPDPSGQSLDTWRTVRDQIGDYSKTLIMALLLGHTNP